MISAILKELIGLFVDDELLAAAILVVVGFTSVLELSGAASGWFLGLMLTLALPVVLAVSVWRSAGRVRRRE